MQPVRPLTACSSSHRREALWPMSLAYPQLLSWSPLCFDSFVHVFIKFLNVLMVARSHLSRKPLKLRAWPEACWAPSCPVCLLPGVGYNYYMSEHVGMRTLQLSHDLLHGLTVALSYCAIVLSDIWFHISSRYFASITCSAIITFSFNANSGVESC